MRTILAILFVVGLAFLPLDAFAQPPAVQAAHISPALIWGVLTFGIVGILAIVLGKKYDLLRDAEPTSFGGATSPAGAKYRRPYSLAQTQMMWWFCIILASFVYLAFMGAEIQNILIPESLVLLGIGMGTALGAAVVDQTKTVPADTPEDKLPTLDKFKLTLKRINDVPAGTVVPPNLIAGRNSLAGLLASEGLFRDILTDVDGISLHRFQSVIWNVVLGGIFLYSVVTQPHDPAAQQHLPVLGSNLLAVLGISGGTYLGFKIPEKPN